MTETEEEERDARRNAYNMTINRFFHQFPITINTQGGSVNVVN